MSRRPTGTGRLFTRQDIYDIRKFWDERWEEGWFYADIARELEKMYPPASTQTLIRIGKRETWKEIGLGPTERANMSNRLAGEARKTGDRTPMPEQNWGRQASDKEMSDIDLALARQKIVVPPGEIKDGLLHVITPGEQGLDMLINRTKEKLPTDHSFDDPPDLPDDADGANSADLLTKHAGDKAK